MTVCSESIAGLTKFCTIFADYTIGSKSAITIQNFVRQAIFWEHTTMIVIFNLTNHLKTFFNPGACTRHYHSSCHCGGVAEVGHPAARPSDPHRLEVARDVVTVVASLAVPCTRSPVSSVCPRSHASTSYAARSFSPDAKKVTVEVLESAWTHMFPIF